jgi:hypothetical protein
MLDSAWFKLVKIGFNQFSFNQFGFNQSGEQECVLEVRIPMKICANT